MQSSDFHAPDPSTAADTDPITTLTGRQAWRGPTDVADLVIALPHGGRILPQVSSTAGLTGRGAIDTPWTRIGRIALTVKIPEQDQGIVRSRSEHAPSRGGPLDTVERGGMSS